MLPKVCYISNFYLGERRAEVTPHTEDRLLFFKHQILTLSQYKHNLTKIIFNFNLREEDISYLNTILDLCPKQIQDTPVELIFRQNKGFSYGAWNDVFKKYREEFDYYIFNEDDYFIADDNFDDYLVKSFNQYQNCGYFCGVAYEQDYYPTHAANCFGITSSKILNEIYQKHGKLPGEMDTYPEMGQLDHSKAYIDLGYEFYDLRETYKIFHSVGGRDEAFIQVYFAWNNKHLILPARVYFKLPFNWTQPDNTQFQLPGVNNKYEKKVTIDITGSKK
jgi:hypothetical protein